MVIDEEIDSILEEARGVIGELEKRIENAWCELRKEQVYMLWWNEQELILPFYLHLQPMIGDLNKSLEKIRVHIVPEYSPKASSYAGDFKEKYGKYPPLNNGEKEFSRTKHVDLCIAAFDSDDFEAKMKEPGMTYWYIKHVPLVLLEFKVNAREYLLGRRLMEKDLEKCAETRRKYYGVEKTYFCYLTDNKLSEEECRKMKEKAKIANLTFCYGTWRGEDWGTCDT